MGYKLSMPSWMHSTSRQEIHNMKNISYQARQYYSFFQSKQYRQSYSNSSPSKIYFACLFHPGFEDDSTVNNNYKMSGESQLFFRILHEPAKINDGLFEIPGWMICFRGVVRYRNFNIIYELWEFFPRMCWSHGGSPIRFRISIFLSLRVMR